MSGTLLQQNRQLARGKPLETPNFRLTVTRKATVDDQRRRQLGGSGGRQPLARGDLFPERQPERGAPLPAVRGLLLRHHLGAAGLSVREVHTEFI